MKLYKRLFALIACLALFTVGCNKQEAKNPQKEKVDEKGSTPILYEVSKQEGEEKLYLLGSIHIGDNTLYPLPSNIMNAYKNSDYLAVEADIVALEKNTDQQVQMLEYMMYMDGSTITDYIDEELYQKVNTLLQDYPLYNENLMITYKPYVFQSFLEQLAGLKHSLGTTYGIDRYFLEKAHEEEKAILEIESVEEQYKMFNEMSLELQTFLLKNVADHFDETTKTTKELYESYKKGDINTLNKLLLEDTEDLSIDEKKQMDQYEDLLITTRNKKMTETAKNYLEEKKNVFYIVGLAHIIGEDGIAKQLEDAGYKVTRIE